MVIIDLFVKVHLLYRCYVIRAREGIFSPDTVVVRVISTDPVINASFSL